MKDNPRSAALILLVTLSLIWGTSFILIKQGLKIFSPDEVGAIRVAAASLCLMPIALFQLRGLQAKQYLRLLASGLLGIFIPAFLFAIAQTRIESSVAGILNTLTPIFTLVIGAIVFQQRFRMISIIGIFVGFMGTAILILTRSGTDLSGGFNPYALLIVVACVCYASNLNLIKYTIPELKAITITSVSVFLIGPIALIYLFFFTHFSEKVIAGNGSFQALAFVVLLGLMGTAIATILFNRLLKISTPLFTSSVTYLIPIVAVVWGLIDHEKLMPGHFVGMAAIIGGVYLANRR